MIALLKEASKKYEQTIIMITHSRSIAQTADRILQVSLSGSAPKAVLPDTYCPVSGNQAAPEKQYSALRSVLVSG